MLSTIATEELPKVNHCTANYSWGQITWNLCTMLFGSSKIFVYSLGHGSVHRVSFSLFGIFLFPRVRQRARRMRKGPRKRYYFRCKTNTIYSGQVQTVREDSSFRGQRGSTRGWLVVLGDGRSGYVCTFATCDRLEASEGFDGVLIATAKLCCQVDRQKLFESPRRC